MKTPSGEERPHRAAPSAALGRLLPIALGTSVVPLDIAVNVAFPAITARFDLPIASIQWVIIGYMLAHGSLMLAGGRLGDLFGHVAVFRAGLLWNTVAFVACAVAPSFEWLLAARVLQGVGAAMIVSCGPALVTALAPESERARMLGYFTLMYAVGAAAGPVLGGLLVTYGGWSAVYWFRAPIALIALLLLRAGPAPPRAGSREPFDLFGAVLLAAGLAGLLLALNQSRALADGGYQALPIGLAAMACLALFTWHELRIAAPIVDLRLFRAPAFALLNLGNAVANLAGFAPFLLGPYFLDRIIGLPTANLGYVLAASPVGAMVASLAGAALLRRWRADAILLLGALMLAVALGAIATWNAGTPGPVILLALLAQGCGSGLFQLAYMDVVTGIMPASARGVAGSLTMLTRTIGVVASASLLTLVFQSLQGRSELAGHGPDAALMAGFSATFVLAACLAALIPLGYALAWRRR